MTVKLALIGAGRIANVHADAITANPDATLVAVTDPCAEAAEKLATRTGARVATPEDIAADEEIDGVLICTPTSTHADLIETFAKAGKHIFCEKPVDLDLARAQQVVTIAQTAGVKLMLGFNRRYDPNFAAARQAITDGKIGAVEMVVITSRDPGAPDLSYARTSGGIFRDMTIHDLDMARFMLGEEPVSVSAHASVLVKQELADIGDFDSVNVILETASGKQAVITNSRRATYGYDQRVEVHGSAGVVDVSNFHENTVRIGNADGFATAPLMNFFMTRYVPSYAGEMKEFVACIKEDRAPATTGEDGVVALRIANACVASVRDGKRVKI
ncbi:inositol 2-dehydrogenase [Donghicola tyrosinivorans]|uniref:Myo-inositol 2-dehydrogenase/D-chiro-inositol 1-dehydrogenase n=1 Tax=Donghicola tyrosinivorans TaxID=1652492 RepID=A0A2T0W8P3_9RHOB|nr:inositol 2-dehydrogenase [Donghicola tyrosinivorans]PRY82904.1 myo-inositol 2-dehydrogenase/D-chiro-inositol 1-dehydrogenase [Donghicola tyrosinivorans]